MRVVPGCLLLLHHQAVISTGFSGVLICYDVRHLLMLQRAEPPLWFARFWRGQNL